MSLPRALCMTALVAALALCSACSRKSSPEELRAWDAELRALQAEQDSLRDRAAVLVANDPRMQRLPKGDVVIAVPTAFLRNVIERVFSDVVDNITLRLSGIKAHVAKSIKKVVKVGEFTLDVEITEVVGKLRPGRPDVRFGGNKVAMSLPIEISEGHGEAILHFVWNGKNVGDLVCGDMDVTRKVSGDVIPASYPLSGGLALKTRGRDVVGALDFPETRVRLRIRPSKASWDSIHAILEEKGGVCGWVLEKVNVPKLLTGIVEERGINVKLPLDKIRPFVLPAGVRDSVKVGEKALAVDARTNLLRIDPDAIWYSADVAVELLRPEEATPPGASQGVAATAPK